MESKSAGIIVALIVLAFFATSAYYYPLLPERIASHWNAEGKVNGFMDKTAALLFLPGIAVLLAALFFAIPRIDPLKANIQKFRGHFNNFIVLLFLFLLYLYALTIAWNLGLRFNMIQFLAPALGLLLFGVGALLKHARQNWFIGIRTPWTLSSRKVWERTHELGSLLFKISGIIAVFGAFFPEAALFLVLVPLIVSVIYLTVFSYFEFKKEKNKKQD